MSNVNGSRSPAEQQLDLVNQILEAGVVVEVGEHTIRLFPPPRSKIAHLHQPIKEEGVLSPEEEQRLSMYNMTAEAVKACIPGLDLDGARGLVALSGGEFCTLAEKAMHLCGLQFILDFSRGRVNEALSGQAVTTTEAANEGGELDPTSA